jgi:hypothetical protein
MQPCHICGAVGIDADGFCLNCRTYRGTVYPVAPSQNAEQYAYGATGSPAAVSGGPAVASGAPYQAPVAYAIDGMQPPTSGGPAALAPPHRSVPMISFMLVAGALVVVLGALVVVLIGTGDGRSVKNAAAASSTSAGPTAPAPSASASASTLAGLDGCVVGSWVVTDEFLAFDADEKTGLTTKSGATWRLDRDGTGVVDYGSGVGYTGKIDGKKAEAWVAGKATFQFSTVNRALNFSAYKADIRAIYIVEKVVEGNESLPLENQAATYACSKDTMTFFPESDHPIALRRQ